MVHLLTLFGHMLFSAVVLEYALVNNLLKRLCLAIDLLLSLLSEIFLHATHPDALRWTTNDNTLLVDE